MNKISTENLVVIAIFFPPLAAYIRCGFGRKFCKNILLTILGFYPGVIHALKIVEISDNDAGNKKC